MTWWRSSDVFNQASCGPNLSEPEWWWPLGAFFLYPQMSQQNKKTRLIGWYRDLYQGLVNVPFWEYWTSPYSSHLVDHIPWFVGWCSMGTWLMTHDYTSQLHHNLREFIGDYDTYLIFPWIFVEAWQPRNRATATGSFPFAKFSQVGTGWWGRKTPTWWLMVIYGDFPWDLMVIFHGIYGGFPWNLMGFTLWLWLT